jgi:hypothetical protein
VRWRYGSSAWGTRNGFPNPPHGAAIYYSLKDEDTGEVKIEILDAQNHLVRTLSSTVREPMGSDDNEDPDDFKKQALARGAGVQRAVWDLRYEGAHKIKGGRIDTGDPAQGPRVAPGAYTVRLTAAGQTRTASVRVVADPRGDLSQKDLEAQAAFALRVRDDISKLTDLVNDIRSVRDQLKARTTALSSRTSEPAVKDLLARSDEAMKKADALEDRLHNPTAEVVYDILAMRGGTRLYSRLSPLEAWAVEAEGTPTAGMTHVLEEQEKELASLESETRTFLGQDVARINDAAAKLNVPFVVTQPR